MSHRDMEYFYALKRIEELDSRVDKMVTENHQLVTENHQLMTENHQQMTENHQLMTEKILKKLLHNHFDQFNRVPLR